MKPGALALATVLAASAWAAEPWYEAYAAGVKAIESGQWSLAEARLQAAIKDGPRPGRSVRTYGTRFITFIPGYYLGVACFRQGRPQEALDQLERVEKAGLVRPEDPEHASLVQVREQASAQLAARAPAAGASPPQRLAHAEVEPPAATLPPAPAATVPAAPTPPTPATADATTAEAARRVELERLLGAGGVHAASGRFAQARETAAQARALGLRDPRVDALQESADWGIGLSELSGLLARRDWTAAQRRALELENRRPADPELRRLRALVDQGLAKLDAGDPERAGIRAFYSGRYQAALTLLEPLGAGQRRTPRALRYAALSAAALGLLLGQPGAPLIEKARALDAEARRLDPRPQPDDKWISPQLREVLQAR